MKQPITRKGFLAAAAGLPLAANELTAAPVAEEHVIVRMARLLAENLKEPQDPGTTAESMMVCLLRTFTRPDFVPPAWLKSHFDWRFHEEIDRAKADGSDCHEHPEYSYFWPCGGCGKTIRRGDTAHFSGEHFYHADCCPACELRERTGRKTPYEIALETATIGLPPAA